MSDQLKLIHDEALPARPLIVTFTRSEEESDWFDTETDTSLCSEGLAEFLEIPNEVNEFRAIFTVDQPESENHFELVLEGSDKDLVGIKSAYNVTWVSSSRALMRKAWETGYRFYEVRYEE